MPQLFDRWYETNSVDVASHRRLHVVRERTGARSSLESEIDAVVASHYEDPKRLSQRIARVGMPRAAELLWKMLPQFKKARSGHLGEILATEAVPIVLTSFYIPIKRLRWLDGRESALRGEDLIGIEQKGSGFRFLKGECKSGASLGPGIVTKAREMLSANEGRPSHHAMGYIMHRLFELGQDELAIHFEEFMLLKSIPAQQIVHLLFTLSGNDASAALRDDLHTCTMNIEQHAVALRIPDHQTFIAAVYERLKKYAP